MRWVAVWRALAALPAQAANPAVDSAKPKAKPTAPAAVPAPVLPEFEKASTVRGNIDPVGPGVKVDADVLKYGEWVYRGLCVRCHGVKGNGEGADWTLTPHDPVNWLPRQPRDFSDPVFKLRSTPSGEMPVERDLFESISRGLLADKDMPAFKFLPERDRWALIAYIKSFSKRWQEEKPSVPIKITAAPVPTPQFIAEGKQIYANMKCAGCHGAVGKGDGQSAGELKDDSGLKITPRDFTDASQFVGPTDPRGVYRTFTTGLDGTPMPSFADHLNEGQRWQLVWYVMSLRKDWNLDRAQRAAKAAVDAAASKPR